MGISKHWAILRLWATFQPMLLARIFIQWRRDHAHKLPHWSQACNFITLIKPSSAAAERVFSLLANSFNSNQESALEEYIRTSVMYTVLQYNHCQMISFCTVTQVFQAIENYGYSLKALWVVCESSGERKYRLRKKNDLSGPSSQSSWLTGQIMYRFHQEHTRHWSMQPCILTCMASTVCFIRGHSTVCDFIMLTFHSIFVPVL